MLDEDNLWKVALILSFSPTSRKDLDHELQSVDATGAALIMQLHLLTSFGDPNNIYNSKKMNAFKPAQNISPFRIYRSVCAQYEA